MKKKSREKYNELIDCNLIFETLNRTTIIF